MTAKWPDFDLVRGLDSAATHQEQWRVTTDTGRPVTPVFGLILMLPPGLPEEERRRIASEELWWRFRKAHPNGCPGSHD